MDGPEVDDGQTALPPTTNETGSNQPPIRSGFEDTHVGNPGQQTSPAALSPLLALPAEIRVRIYTWLLRSIYIDPWGYVTSPRMWHYGNVVKNLLLTCKLFHAEVPHVVADTVCVHMHKQHHYGPDGTDPTTKFKKKFYIAPVFRQAKHIRGCWARIPVLDNDGRRVRKPCIPVDLVKSRGYEWKSLTMKAIWGIQDVRENAHDTSRPDRLELALVNLRRELKDVDEYIRSFPDLDVRVLLNMYSVKTRKSVCQLDIRGGQFRIRTSVLKDENRQEILETVSRVLEVPATLV